MDNQGYDGVTDKTRLPDGTWIYGWDGVTKEHIIDLLCDIYVGTRKSRKRPWKHAQGQGVSQWHMHLDYNRGHKIRTQNKSSDHMWD